MSFNIDDAFELEEGIVFFDRDFGIFGGSTDPTGSDAPVGTRYFQTSNGIIWRKTGAGANDWVEEHKPGRSAGIDHNNMFRSRFGRRVWNTTFTTIYSGPLSGSSSYPPQTVYEFVTFCQVEDSNDPCEVRLYDSDNLTTLATQTIDYETPQFQRTTFTFSGGDVIADVDARCTIFNSNITIFNAGVITSWVQV